MGLLPAFWVADKAVDPGSALTRGNSASSVWSRAVSTSLEVTEVGGLDTGVCL